MFRIQVSLNIRFLIDFIMSEDIKDTNQLIAHSNSETANNQESIAQVQNLQGQKIAQIDVQKFQPPRTDDITILLNTQQELNELSNIVQKTQQFQQKQSLLGLLVNPTQQLVTFREEDNPIFVQEVQEANLNKQREANASQTSEMNATQRYYPLQEVISSINEGTNQQNNEILASNSNFQGMMEADEQIPSQTEKVSNNQSYKTSHHFEQIPVQEYRDEDLFIDNVQREKTGNSEFKFIGMQEGNLRKENTEQQKPKDKNESLFEPNSQITLNINSQVRVQNLPILEIVQLDQQKKGNQKSNQASTILRIDETSKIKIEQNFSQTQKIRVTEFKQNKSQVKLKVQQPKIVIKQEIKIKKQVTNSSLKQVKDVQQLKKEDIAKKQVQQSYFKQLPKKTEIAPLNKSQHVQNQSKTINYFKKLPPKQIAHEQQEGNLIKTIKKTEDKSHLQSQQNKKQFNKPQQVAIKQTQHIQAKNKKKIHKKKKQNEERKSSEQIAKHEQILPSNLKQNEKSIPSNQNNDKSPKQNGPPKQTQTFLVASTANSLQNPTAINLQNVNRQNISSDPQAPVITNQFIILQAERERMNSTYNIFFKYMMNYTKALNFYKNIVENVYQQIFRKKNQKRILENILLNYFEGYAKLNLEFSEDNTKIPPFQLPASKNPYGNIGLELRRGFDELIYLRRTVAAQNLKINNFCISTIVQGIVKAFTKYYDRISAQQSKFFERRQQHDGRQRMFYKVVSQVDKVFRQGIDGKFKKDILSQVARLINEQQGHRQILRNYGRSIMPVRLTFLSAQRQLFESLQSILNQFKNQSKVIYSVGKKEFHYIQDLTHSIKQKNDFEHLSPLTDTDYIKYVLQFESKKETNSYNNLHFEHFLEMTYFDKIVGNIRDIYKGTINKSFPLSAPNEELIHTISGNLVQFNREMDHVLNTFVVNNINAKIINDGVVQFDQVLKGIIFNDYRTIRVKLLDRDRAEELICYLNQKTETIVIK